MGKLCIICFVVSATAFAFSDLDTLEERRAEHDSAISVEYALERVPAQSQKNMADFAAPVAMMQVVADECPGASFEAKTAADMVYHAFAGNKEFDLAYGDTMLISQTSIDTIGAAEWCAVSKELVPSFFE